MLKKIIGTLGLIFILQMLVLGISGCENEKERVLNSNSQTQSALINSGETLNKTSNATKLPVVQRPQAVPVLYYHSVMLEEGNEVRMPPDQFEAQMAYMRDKGYESVTLDQLYLAYNNGEGLPAKPFVVTFDDGYVDNYTTAFPILKKYGFVATVFMVTSYINGEGFMSWSQLKELISSGWEIEGHTVNHPYLSQIDKTAVFKELKSSKELLEKGLGQPIDFFAYPYGDVNADVAMAVKDSGYLMAFTTERGWADINLDQWHLQRVYCFANMGLNEFSRRLHNPNY